MSEQGNILSYALTPNLGRSAKSVAVKRYSAQMKSTGTFGDAELQEALASESKVSVEQIRYLEAVRCRIIENALRNVPSGRALRAETKRRNAMTDNILNLVAD